MREAFRSRSPVHRGLPRGQLLGEAGKLCSDTEERRDKMVMDWNRLQAEIQDKRRDLENLSGKIRKTSQVDQRFSSLVAALLELLDT